MVRRKRLALALGGAFPNLGRLTSCIEFLTYDQRNTLRYYKELECVDPIRVLGELDKDDMWNLAIDKQLRKASTTMSIPELHDPPEINHVGRGLKR